jgi:hypothetical protein
MVKTKKSKNGKKRNYRHTRRERTSMKGGAWAAPADPRAANAIDNPLGTALADLLSDYQPVDTTTNGYKVTQGPGGSYKISKTTYDVDWTIDDNPQTGVEYFIIPNYLMKFSQALFPDASVFGNEGGRGNPDNNNDNALSNGGTEPVANSFAKAFTSILYVLGKDNTDEAITDMTQNTQIA